jgi:hypothetical protein
MSSIWALPVPRFSAVGDDVIHGLYSAGRQMAEGFDDGLQEFR